MDIPDARYRVDQALLGAGICPPRFIEEADSLETSGPGGISGPDREGRWIIWCQAPKCPQGFEFMGRREDLKEELDRRGWSFREHYVETQARPVSRELFCPEHLG